MAQNADIADDPDPAGPRRPFAAELWEVTQHYRGRIAVSVLLLIVAKIATVAVPLVLKRIIDAFSQPSLPARLPLYLLAAAPTASPSCLVSGCSPSSRPWSRSAWCWS
jgi:ABC-type multidrug transport system fused ATPase/permease subunit